MVDLDHIPIADLQTALADTDSATPTLRLVVALNYKHGLTQTEIAEQYGLARKTVYNWLSRIATQPLTEAIYDENRPGRPSRLSAVDRRRLRRLLRERPAKLGIDADTWTTEATQALIRDAFGVEYSLGHVRRLLRTNRTN